MLFVSFRFYKYIGIEPKYWIENLRQCRFAVSKPSDFNDPFDCTGVIREPWCDEAKKQFHDRETFLGKMNDRSWADEFYRVLCLTDAQSSDAASEALLWSHYADKGRGIRITIEIADNADFVPQGRIQCMRYCHAKPVFDMAQYKENSPALMDYLCDCIWTKGNGWAYEHELRVIFDAEATFRDKTIGNEDLRFVRFASSCVKEVTFGPMVAVKDAQEFASELIPVFVDSSIFYRAVRDDVYYRYNYRSLFDDVCVGMNFQGLKRVKEAHTH